MPETQVLTGFDFGPKFARGVCSECGAPAWDGRATKCEQHRKRTNREKVTAPRPTTTGTTTVKPDTSTSADDPVILTPPPFDGPPPPPPPPPPPSSKEDRAARIERMLLDDVNPELIRGFAFLCRPVAPQTFYVVDGNGKVIPTEYGSQVGLNAMEAKILGMAGAEVEGSPAVSTAKAFAGPLMPVFLGIGAVGVVAYHGFKLNMLRDGLMAQVRAAQMAQMANGPAPQEEEPNTAAGPVHVPDAPGGDDPPVHTVPTSRDAVPIHDAATLEEMFQT